MRSLLRQSRVALGALLVAAVLIGPSASAWASGPPDGVTWTSHAIPGYSWAGVTYGNGLFVAVRGSGTGDRVMTSPDGVTWTSRATPADNDWSSVAYGGGVFVAVASSGTGDRVMTSPDGITWTLRTSAADYDWRRITYGNGLFVAVATTGSHFMTSPDGITWTLRSNGGASNWWGVTYGDGLFVAVSTWSIRTSPDGITWTARSVPSTNPWVSVTYGNGMFVAVATNTGAGNHVMTSPDGITWTGRSAVPGNWWGITYGAGLFVAVAAWPSNLMTSPDGVTWTARDASGGHGSVAIAYGSGVFTTPSLSDPIVRTNGTLDTAAPNAPAITSGPTEGSVTAATHPTFAFSATDNTGGSGIAAYECRLDTPAGTGTWTACADGTGYTMTTSGTYAFHVRASDTAGNTGPASIRTWRFDAIPPRTRLTDTVPTYLATSAVALRFSSDQADATFRCRVDDGAWAACASPATFALDEGAHSLLVQAVSRSGVTDPDPVVVTLVIDRTAPQIEIERASITAPATSDPGFAARLRSNESGVRFECRLNAGVWAECSDQPRYEGLPSGGQTFAARAVDRAGNVSTDPATRTWQLRGATRPLAVQQLADPRRLDCDSSQLTGVETISYQWRRDRTTLKSTTDRHTITSRDNGSRLTCTATITFASGVTTRYTAPPILIDRSTRLTNFTTTTRRAPTATFTVNQDHLVLIRLWCRSTTHTCKAPSKPTDYLRPAGASYTPAGLTKYRRIVTRATKGTNHINLTRFLPTGLPAGDYKLTIRLARRTKTGRLATTNFLHQDLRVGPTR